MTITRGVLVLILGVIGLGIVYSMRPPSGLGDAFSMLMQGKRTYIKPPLYEILLGVSGMLTFVGAAVTLRGVLTISKSASNHSGTP